MPGICGYGIEVCAKIPLFAQLLPDLQLSQSFFRGNTVFIPAAGSVIGLFHGLKRYNGVGVLGVLRHMGETSGQFITVSINTEAAVYTALQIIASFSCPEKPAKVQLYTCGIFYHPCMMHHWQMKGQSSREFVYKPHTPAQMRQHCIYAAYKYSVRFFQKQFREKAIGGKDAVSGCRKPLHDVLQ